MEEEVKKTIFIVLALMLFSAYDAFAQTNVFLDRVSFENQLGSMIVDDYSHPDYLHGDLHDGANLDKFSDSAMSAIINETAYTTTGWTDNNIIVESFYCAGCNGSFLLDFTSTSMGSSAGVYGAGFDTRFNYDTLPLGPASQGYHAYVTFGDDATADYVLPITSDPSFWSITSTDLIKNIHIGLENGGTSIDGAFGMDNLTVGSLNVVPEPISSTLFIVGGAFFAGRRFLQKRKRA